MEHLGGKIFLANDIEDYSIDELEQVKTAVQKELQKRRNEKLKNDWKQIVDLLHAFNKEYGVVLESDETGETHDFWEIEEQTLGVIFFN